jgi:sigma-B regulation protein RsbU (phosphoserine phosphatase)
LPEGVTQLAHALGVQIPEQVSYRAVRSQASSALRTLWRSYCDLQQTSTALLGERLAAAERLEEAKERVAAAHKRDLEIIGAAQSMFLPASSRVSAKRCEVSGFYRSAEECGGDWWWYENTDNSFRLMVGDIIGHGASAAMVTGIISGIVRVNADYLRLSTGELIEVLHRELEATAKGAYFMTLSVIEIPDGGDFAYWYNAAAPPLLVLTPEGQINSIVRKGNLVGSRVDNFEIETAEIPITPGMRILCCTDGMFEFPTVESGAPLGQRGLRRILMKTHGRSIQTATDTIVRGVTELYPQDIPQEDDMTFTLIDIK